jgi:hypothetical protein
LACATTLVGEPPEVWRAPPKLREIESIFHNNAHDGIAIRKQSNIFSILDAKRVTQLF